jgi:hypothetical protein
MSSALRGRRSGVVPGVADARVLLVCDEAEVATWPLVVSGRPTMDVVDELFRLALAAARLGGSIRVRDGDGRLRELLDLVGLAGIVPVVSLGIEVAGEPEGGEQPGVEEVVVTDDPVA